MDGLTKSRPIPTDAVRVQHVRRNAPPHATDPRAPDRSTIEQLARISPARPFSDALQATIRRPVTCTGIGLHGGRAVQVRLLPAPVGAGIAFRRTDRPHAATIAARHDRVVDTRLCTLIADAADPDIRVGTIEHLMAALAASGIDNLLVELDAPELPILDGSSLPWLELLADAGLLRQDRQAAIIEILRPVTVRRGDSVATLLPAPGLPRPSLGLDIGIAFDDPAIGTQTLRIDRVDETAFREELADCRTFTLAHEIAALRNAGLARGGSLDNAIVVQSGRVLNPDGLRRPDEFVRHKALDAIGDLALAGARLHGVLHARRPGHALNNQILHALFADPAAWRFADAAATRHTQATA